MDFRAAHSGISIYSTSETSYVSEFDDPEESIHSIESELIPSKNRALSTILEYSEEDSFEQKYVRYT